MGRNGHCILEIMTWQEELSCLLNSVQVMSMSDYRPAARN
jgi:hypothetical protein